MIWTKKIHQFLGVLLGAALALIFVFGFMNYALSMTAGPFEVRPSGLLWNPPICINNDRRVGTVFISTKEFWEHGRALGTTVTHPRTGEVLIALDATHFPRMPPELQRFIIHHECGHINLGHLRWIIHPDPHSLEKEAECYAMNAARREGWPPERFNATFDAMLDYELMRPAFKGIVPDEYVAKGHVWTPEERVEYAKSCPLP